MLNKNEKPCFYYILFALCTALALQFLSGCGKGEQQQNVQLQSAQQKQTEEKESEKLKGIESKIEELFEVLGGPSVKLETTSGSKGGAGKKQQGTKQNTGKQPTGKSQGTGQQGTKSQGGKQQGTKKKSSKGQGTGQQGTGQKAGKKKSGSQGGSQSKSGAKSPQQAQQVPKWTEVDKLINTLHYQWNGLMPEIAKKGADMKLVDSFDNALNSLTTTIATRDTGKVLLSANALYSNIPDLYSLYRVKMSPEAKRLIFYTRNVILESAKDNWTQVKKDDESIEKSWSLFRNTLDKEQKQVGDMLDFSVYELKKVISEKNRQLAGIKGKIVLNNIKELQKSFEQKK